MKRTIALIVLALLAFYAAWPAWSGYRISQALQNDDATLLDSKIDFPSVRASLRPVVTTEITGRLEQVKREAGPLGSLIAGQFKDDLVTRIVDGTLNTVVTPEAVVRIVRQGGDLREAVERVALEQILKPGGNREAGGGLRLPGRNPPAGSPTLPGRPANAEEPSRTPQEVKPKFGISNIKSFRFGGPLSYSVGVARKAEATESDVTVSLAFTGGDWKVVSIIPKLPAAATIGTR